MNIEDQLRDRVDQLEKRVADYEGNAGIASPCHRWRSKREIWGLPLVDIAFGPNPTNHQTQGHAKGIIAIGDIATGVVAVGGFAAGGIALGGVSVGGISLGGAAIGVLLGVGGLATGLLAVGGAAIGIIAIGGGAFGYYAIGGGAVGVHVIDAVTQDPEAVRFFGKALP